MPVCRPGPGVLLIAHEANYSLDCNTNRLSLLYNRKATGSGTPQEHLSQAYDSAVAACRRFVQEPEFRSKLEFDFDDVELIFNDRLLHPNTEAAWQEIQLDVKQFFDGIFGS